MVLPVSLSKLCRSCSAILGGYLCVPDDLARKIDQARLRDSFLRGEPCYWLLPSRALGFSRPTWPSPRFLFPQLLHTCSRFRWLFRYPFLRLPSYRPILALTVLRHREPSVHSPQPPRKPIMLLERICPRALLAGR